MPNEVLQRPGPQHGRGVGLPRVLARWFEPDQVRNADRFYTVVFVLAVVVVGAAANVVADGGAERPALPRGRAAAGSSWPAAGCSSCTR